jgi:hypothetical protein
LLTFISSFFHWHTPSSAGIVVASAAAASLLSSVAISEARSFLLVITKSVTIRGRDAASFLLVHHGKKLRRITTCCRDAMCFLLVNHDKRAHCIASQQQVVTPCAFTSNCVLASRQEGMTPWTNTVIFIDCEQAAWSGNMEDKSG